MIWQALTGFPVWYNKHTGKAGKIFWKRYTYFGVFPRWNTHPSSGHVGHEWLSSSFHLVFLSPRMRAVLQSSGCYLDVQFLLGTNPPLSLKEMASFYFGHLPDLSKGKAWICFVLPSVLQRNISQFWVSEHVDTRLSFGSNEMLECEPCLGEEDQCVIRRTKLLGFITGKQLMESIFFVSLDMDLPEYWYVHVSPGSFSTRTKQLL